MFSSRLEGFVTNVRLTETIIGIQRLSVRLPDFRMMVVVGCEALVDHWTR